MTKALQNESQGTGHTLICLHGLGGKGNWFQGFSENLKTHYRIITLDLPGTGSNRVGHSPFTLDHCLAALTEWIQSLTGPITLVGQSMGTILALKLQAAMPNRFSSLIFVGGLPEIIPAIRIRLQERRELILKQGLSGIGKPAARGVFSKRSQETNPALIDQFAEELEALSQGEYVEGIEILLSASAIPEIPSAKLPCLILAGSDDSYAPPSSINTFVTVLPKPVTRVELPNCGHMVFLEDSPRFSQEIKTFLENVSEA